MNPEDLTFSDFLPTIAKLGKGEWTTVYSSRDSLDGVAIYSALMKTTLVKKALERPSWDLSIGDGAPGIESSYRAGRERTRYVRTSDSGIEPLILKRSFHDIRLGYWEVAEDFRLYFNLYEDKQSRKLLRIDENGDEHEVVLMKDGEIKIKTYLIRQYLNIRKMKLAIFFDYNRLSSKTIEELCIQEGSKEEKGVDFIYSVGAGRWQGFSDNTKKSHGRLCGKKIVAGDPSPKTDKYGRPKKEYIDFIIGADDDGKEVLSTCNEAKLANNFGANEGAPHYLTPVCFRKEVLNKYYAQPEKYTVTDGYLACGAVWSLYIDNNHPDAVMVFLGDLGHLSHTEQMYWRGFNLSSRGTMSRVAFRRSIMGQFADPQTPDLYFKQRFGIFNEYWKKKFGWELFKPLTGKDEYAFKILRKPLTNDIREFDEQVATLTKVFIDSLNEKELEKGITNRENAKGLEKFENWLRAEKFHSPKMMEFLRKLQALRSASTAHRKSDNYEKIKPFFEIDKKELAEVLEDIFIKCVWTLRTLEKYFLPDVPKEEDVDYDV
jgi:hypothetical protein